MSSETAIQIRRKPEVLSQTGFARTTLNTRINDGLFVPPISLGDRAVGWLEHEVQAVLEAMAAGKPKEEIQALVASLIQGRQHFAGAHS